MGFALARKPRSVLLLHTSSDDLPPMIAHYCSDYGVAVFKSEEDLYEKIKDKIFEVR